MVEAAVVKKFTSFTISSPDEFLVAIGTRLRSMAKRDKDSAASVASASFSRNEHLISRTKDQIVAAGSTSTTDITILIKLFTKSAVLPSSKILYQSQAALLCGWRDNRRSGLALETHWCSYLRAASSRSSKRFVHSPLEYQSSDLSLVYGVRQ